MKNYFKISLLYSLLIAALAFIPQKTNSQIPCIEGCSILRLGEVDIDGVKQKSNGKIIKDNRLKTLKSIRIGFDTGDNRFLASGPLTFYYRITDPSGMVLTDTGATTGILLTSSGVKEQYSKTMNINWKGANNRVEVYWKKNFTASGIFKVEIYQEGFLIGVGEVTLR